MLVNAVGELLVVFSWAGKRTDD